MAKQNAQRPSDMQNLVNGYNKMMEDPKQYANTTYLSQIKSQGRPWGGTRDARTKANKPWDKNGIPV
jgi:hypothetical protein